MRNIRPATVQDVPRLLEIYGEYVTSTAITFEYTVPTEAEFAARLAQTTRRYPYLVLEEDGRVTGYAYAAALNERAAYDWSCELTVYVDSRYRRGGRGRLLYEALEAELAAQGICNLYACVAAPVGDDPYLTDDSERFHERLGFRTVGRFSRCGYKLGRWYDVLWMEKTVGEHAASPVPPTWKK